MPVQDTPAKPARAAKSIFRSKTFWINAILAATAIGLEIESFLRSGQFSSAGITVGVIGIVNIALRTISKEAVSWK